MLQRDSKRALYDSFDTCLKQYPLRLLIQMCVSELIDLCDERGVLKFLFLPQNSQESARGLLKAKESFIVCTIKCEFEFVRDSF